jgi:peptidyl-prolyl cis-trans isomerase B (cyclophilin B)
MSHFRTIPVSFLALLLALPAQDGAKPPQEPATKTEAKAPLDDATTANDPAVVAIDKFIAEQKIDKKIGWKTTLSKPPMLPFAKDSDYFWHLETECGAMKIRWFAEASPAHVSSGLYLARLGFYDGLTFHRVIPGFMAQGGDPLGTGGGGPGYRIDAEFKNGLKHGKIGILSMARTPDPNSAGSQFFITFKDTSMLDDSPERPGYTVWGEVVEGLETVKALERKGNPNPAENGTMKTPLKIHRTWVSVAPKPKQAAPAKAEPAKEAEKK